LSNETPGSFYSFSLPSLSPGVGGTGSFAGLVRSGRRSRESFGGSDPLDSVYTDRMLSTYAQVELLVAGLRNAPPDPERPPMLSITEGDRFAWAGYQGFDIPDANLEPGDAAEFALGRWAATGHRAWMDELIRQARHRDGSSHSIATSSYAMEILRVAVETDSDFDRLLRSRGYDASSIKFGAFPPGTSLQPGAGSRWDCRPPAIPVAVPPEATDTSTVNEATVIAEGVVGMGISDTAQTDGRVILALHGQTYALSITDARGAADALERAIRALLLPGEGYRWDDSSTLTSSALVVFDSELVKDFEPFTMLNASDGPDAEGRFVLGRVVIESDGRFIGEVFTKQPRKERRGDMNDAKFHVAQRVRDLLADTAAQLAASVAP
jgi:hypothetical protein